MITLHIVVTADADCSLACFPIADTEIVRDWREIASEDCIDVYIDLEQFDLNVAQEQYLDTSVDVIKYSVLA